MNPFKHILRLYIYIYIDEKKSLCIIQQLHVYIYPKLVHYSCNNNKQNKRVVD